jgi:hypothetical protein
MMGGARCAAGIKRPDQMTVEGPVPSYIEPDLAMVDSYLADLGLGDASA